MLNIIQTVRMRRAGGSSCSSLWPQGAPCCRVQSKSSTNICSTEPNSGDFRGQHKHTLGMQEHSLLLGGFKAVCTKPYDVANYYLVFILDRQILESISFSCSGMYGNFLRTMSQSPSSKTWAFLYFFF